MGSPNQVIPYADLDRDEAVRLMRKGQPVLVQMSPRDTLHFALMKEAETLAERAMQRMESDARKREVGSVAIVMFFAGVMLSWIVGVVFSLLFGG